LQYITGNPLTLLKQATGTALAACPSGLKVISGGFMTTVPPGSNASPVALEVFNSVFSGVNGWSVSATNTANGNNAALILTAYAICAFVQ
jgi:hypothetical protein